MNDFMTLSFAVLLLSATMITSCTSDSTRGPVHESEIIMDEDYNIVDLGRSGESTADGRYYYNGYVILYDEDGYSRTFRCYRGKIGMESGCRGVIVGGEFYNLDRNDWVTIDGVRYKAYDLLD